jgi:hypothetical protein
MWCPEGYTTLSHIIGSFSWDSDLIGAASDSPSQGEKPEGTQIDTGIDGIEMRAFVNWLLVVFFRRFSRDLRVCTTSGALLKLDNTAYLSSLNSLFDGNIVFQKYEKTFPLQYEDRTVISKIFFNFIDSDLGCVKRDLPYDHYYTPLAGMPLCIKKASLPVSSYQLAQWLLDRGIDIFDNNLNSNSAGNSVELKKGGRPSLKSQVVSDFLSAYPQGLQGAPLVEVAERLGYDRKTVREALIAAGLYLSKSGQKRGENPRIG